MRSASGPLRTPSWIWAAEKQCHRFSVGVLGRWRGWSSIWERSIVRYGYLKVVMRDCSHFGRGVDCSVVQRGTLARRGVCVSVCMYVHGYLSLER